MRTVLATALLLVTAGCAGVTAPKPAPGDGYPPGVSADGIENATALLGAHDEAVVDAGIAYEYERASNQTALEAGVHDEPNRSVRATGRQLGDRRRARTEYSGPDGTDAVVAFANGTHLVKRIAEPDGESFLRGHALPPDHQTHPRGWDIVTSTLREWNYTVTDRYVEDGHTLVALTAVSPEADDPDTTASGRVVVDLDGRIHEYAVEIVRETEAERERWRFAFEATQFGVADVRKPSWTDEALNAIDARFRVGLGAEREHVVVDHAGGDAWPAGSTVEVTHDGETYTATIDETLRAGQSLYVGFTGDGDLRLAYEDPPREHPTLDGTYVVHIYGPNGSAILDGGETVTAGPWGRDEAE